jgi:hypothetical protein
MVLPSRVRNATSIAVALASVTLVMPAQKAQAQAPVSRAASKPNRAISPARWFAGAKAAFWAVEPKFNYTSNNFENLPVLAKDDPLVPRYRHAAHAAQAFLAAQESTGGESDVRTPIALYFAAMAYSRAGDDGEAIHYLTLLTTRFPDYRRPRMNGYPQFARLCRPDCLRLKLYHEQRLGTTKTLADLRSVIADATAALQPVPATGGRFEPTLQSGFRTPDQFRTDAVPDVLALQDAIFEKALPGVVRSSGGKAVRDLLRSLQGTPLWGYASYELPQLDKAILAGYRAKALQAMAAKRYAEAKTAWQLILTEYKGTPAADEAVTGMRKATVALYSANAAADLAAKRFTEARTWEARIISEYPGSGEATLAQAELTKMVPVAVQYYATEGDKVFQPARQIGVAQDKAEGYYRQMLEADPDGPRADYALLRWSRALATQGKVKEALAQLGQLEIKFPSSPLKAEALYAGAFMAGAPNWRN